MTGRKVTLIFPPYEKVRRGKIFALPWEMGHTKRISKDMILPVSCGHLSGNAG